MKHIQVTPEHINAAVHLIRSTGWIPGPALARVRKEATEEGEELVYHHHDMIRHAGCSYSIEGALVQALIKCPQCVVDGEEVRVDWERDWGFLLGVYKDGEPLRVDLLEAPGPWVHSAEGAIEYLEDMAAAVEEGEGTFTLGYISWLDPHR